MNKSNIKAMRFVIILIICIVSFPVNAQTSCDKLFTSGVKYQQTMTIASQNKAITYFEKAKVCYDSQSKKNLCDEQITACRNIIAQISKNAKQASSPNTNSVPKDDVDSLTAKPIVEENAPTKTDVQLSLDCTYLKFKGKGDEFKKAKITCNYPDWEIIEKPDWVNCSKSDGEIVVEADKNSTKEERSGSIIIECGDKSVTLTIIQEKSKKFGVIF